MTLLRPGNYARMNRFPPGDLEWTTVDAHIAAYVLEWQMGQPGGEIWLPREIRIIHPAPGKASIAITSPIGAGRQPHRWRIWAIGRTGVLSTSEWRIIDFTN